MPCSLCVGKSVVFFFFLHYLWCIITYIVIFFVNVLHHWNIFLKVYLGGWNEASAPSRSLTDAAVGSFPSALCSWLPVPAVCQLSIRDFGLRLPDLINGLRNPVWSFVSMCCLTTERVFVVTAFAETGPLDGLESLWQWVRQWESGSLGVTLNGTPLESKM